MEQKMAEQEKPRAMCIRGHIFEGFGWFGRSCGLLMGMYL